MIRKLWRKVTAPVRAPIELMRHRKQAAFRAMILLRAEHAAFAERLRQLGHPPTNSHAVTNAAFWKAYHELGTWWEREAELARLDVIEMAKDSEVLFAMAHMAGVWSHHNYAATAADDDRG